MLDGPLTVTRDGIVVAVRLSPRAKADRLAGTASAADGRRVLKASVTAPAEGGRANQALLQLLARAWGVPLRDFSIAAGATSRRKAVRLAGDPEQLVARISPQISRLPRL